ncbi:MAG: hypothetical protein ABJA94_04300 [Rhodoglobus sp.]
MFEDIFDNPVPGPISGDPELIRRFATNYTATAEALRDAAKELRALANDSITISLAVDQVRDKANEAYSDTLKVAERYEGAGATYFAYQSALSAAQTHAQNAIHYIITNNDNARYWRRHQKELQLEVLVDPSKATDLVAANTKVNHYTSEYHQAIGQYNTAVEDKRRAVLQAVAGLNEASQRAGLNDNFFEAVQGAGEVLYDLAQKYLTPILQKLRAVLEIIKSIVDIISLIVTILAIFVPVLAPLAAALAIASIALSVGILLCSLALFSLGKETLGRVLGDTINVAASIITAKMGGAFKPGALTGFGASMAKVGSGFSAASKLTVKEAGVVLEISGKEALIDKGKELVVNSTASLLNFGAEQIGTDNRAGGSPWGAVSAPSASEFGGALLDTAGSAATLGLGGAFGDIQSAMGDYNSATNDQNNNIGAFFGVPS